MATAGSIVVDLLMRTGAFETDTARAEKLMKQRMKAIEESVNSAASAIALGGVAIAGGMMLWVKQAADAADQLDQLSERTGVAVETLNGLSYATRMSGGDIGELEKGLQSLNKKLSEVAAGDKSAKDMFKALGLTATTAEDALMQLADVFPQLSKQDQVRVGTDLLGKSYQSLVPLLAQGRDGLQALIEEGQTLNPITAETAAQAALFNDNLDRLKTLSDSAAISVGNTLIPALNNLTQEFILGLKHSDGFFDALMKYGLTNPFSTLEGNLTRITAEYESLDFKLSNGRSTDEAADREKLRGLGQQLEYYRAIKAAQDGSGKTSPASAGRKAPVLPSLAPEKKKAPAYTDPLADEAKAYAAAMDSINKAQLSAQTSGMELTATQQRLLDLFASPEWLTMPDAWKQSVVQQAEFSIEAENAAKKTEELNKQQERLRDLLGETDLEKKRADMLLLAEAFESGRITAEEYGLAVKNALGVGDDEGGYWDKWLKAAEESLTSFDELAGNVVENFGRQFGNTFEKMIFDSQSLGDAVTGLAEGMARSVVNALGQMAAQWLAYQVVQMVVGKTTAASAATAQTFEAMAAQQMAAINAFASTAAIPIVGPELAPAAAEAALMATTPFVATIASLGAAAAGARADGGPVSANAPYLIGERGPELFVPNTAGRVLPNSALGGNSSPTINLIEDRRRAGQTQQRNTNGRDEIDVFVADILGDGPRAKAVQKAFGLQRRGY